MPSRMTDEQLAKAKGAAREANELAATADAAHGLGVTRVAREKARDALDALDPKGAERQWKFARKRRVRG